jgi:uncharacterized protein
VSALIFSRRSMSWIRDAWQARRFVPLASSDTARELLRVLRYSKFKLSREEQSALLGEILPYVEAVRVDDAPVGLPPVRDPDDIMFQALAIVSGADALVSGDGDLLAIQGQWPIPVLTVNEFEVWLGQRPTGR